jgi:hypothetical protein
MKASTVGAEYLIATGFNPWKEKQAKSKSPVGAIYLLEIDDF